MNRVNDMIAERYLIESSIGEGGMADVYLAKDTILNREVAIKVLRGELSKDPLALLRFQREASAVSKLSHPNVVDVYDVGEFEGHHYIVMEYIKGRTLKQLIAARGALDKEESVNIMRQLTSAIQHAHEHNIIHRDIKPQNVLVKDDGTIKITDFGIALAHDAIQLTQSDAVLGSAHYLAPESTKGEAPTFQVDIYALGIVFYELLTGSVPFKGDNPVQIAMKHLREEIPSVKAFNPTLPQSIENIITHATVKNRKWRYQSTKEMLYDLEHCLEPAMANVEKLVFADNADTLVLDKQAKIVTKSSKASTNVNKKTTHSNSAKKSVKRTTKQEQLKRKKKGLYIAIATMVVALMILLVVMFMPKNATIPSVVGVSQEQAIDMLLDAGFKKQNIKIEEEMSLDHQEGMVTNVNPAEKKELKSNQVITLTVSSGKYFVCKDYRKRSFASVKEELEKEAPNITLIVKEVVDASYKPGYVMDQSGLAIGESYDPSKPLELSLTISKRAEFKVDFEGKKVEDVKHHLEKINIFPVLEKIEKPEGEEDAQEGVVVRSNPEQGSWYIQEGTNTITLYYY